MCYSQNIRLPPTREDAVKEILKRSQSVNTECGDKYTIVTYDLATAKIERQVQIQNCSKLDSFFIESGQFHIILSLLSSTGK